MAVLPELQRQGIASRLVRAGIEMLKIEGSPIIILLGHPVMLSSLRLCASFA
jgi:predicted N-acetyltransferase YhbS